MRNNRDAMSFNQLFGVAVSLILVFLVSSSCEKNLTGPEKVQYCQIETKIPLDSARTYDYQINFLEYPKLPYSRWQLTSFDDYAKDENGIILFDVEGRYQYNPTQMSQKMMQFLESYRRTKEERYLHECIKIGNKLIEIAHIQEEALFFPFKFYWPFKEEVHVMAPPWYGGMAQGQALSAFIRLYQATNDDNYLRISNQIRKSLILVKDDYDPWVVYVDEKGYYWIEEYPESCPNHVLNGFVFALYGLYDHYRITGDTTSLFLLRAGIKTVADHIEGWRQPGDLSKYTLKYHITSEFYHHIHVRILWRLSVITGDPFFKDMSEKFMADYYKPGIISEPWK